MAIVMAPFRLTGAPVEVVVAGVVAAAVVTSGAVGYSVLQPSLLQHFMSQLFMNKPVLAFIISLRTRQPVEGVGQ